MPSAPFHEEVGRRFSAAGKWVEVYARARLPTRFGKFDLYVIRTNVDDKEHLALVRGTLRGKKNLPVRVHSECFTGDVLTSLRCDCREQLELALAMLAKRRNSLLIYLRQEGRGIGLGNKIRAYTLQEQGLDTIEANLNLGFASDLRDYRVAALILRMFGVSSVHLLTNNPRKIEGLTENKIEVSGRLPLVTVANPHNMSYLQVKASKAGHLLPAKKRA